MRITCLTILFACALAACAPPASAPADTGAAPATQSTPPPVAAAVADLAQVSSPAANATVTSPLHVTGIAPANWYFENSFPVRIVDAQGQVLAEGPATPRVNWTENAEPKAFDATLTFTAAGPATLVLQEDMPRDDGAPREVRVPVVLGH